VQLEIVFVPLRQGNVVDDQQIFGIAGLGCLSEIETAGDNGLPVNDDDLVVRNHMLRINEDRNASVSQVIGAAVVLRPVPLVQDGNHFHPSLLRRGQGFRDSRRGETVGLKANRLLRLPRFARYGIGASAVR